MRALWWKLLEDGDDVDGIPIGSASHLSLMPMECIDQAPYFSQATETGHADILGTITTALRPGVDAVDLDSDWTAIRTEAPTVFDFAPAISIYFDHRLFYQIRILPPRQLFLAVPEGMTEMRVVYRDPLGAGMGAWIHLWEEVK